MSLDLQSLLKATLDAGGSDLHLATGQPPLIRLRGKMVRSQAAPLDLESAKSLIFSAMSEGHRKAFESGAEVDFAFELPGLARFRANVFRQRHGISAVYRVIVTKIRTLEELGTPPILRELCMKERGLVLVTGPTGSGKSTTLAAMIDHVNEHRHGHIITIEDPIEFVHENKNCIITQRQVGVHTGSFKSALRAALREDPDIILVGELRDLETVAIAIETAETGHLVFGTLHTTTAAGTIDRIIDQFPADRQEQIRVMLADCLKGVISQTLCKKVGGGRVAAREILLSVPALSNLIREKKSFQIPSIMQTSRKLGMIQLGDVLIDLVDQGLVEPKEAFMKSTDKTSFMTMLKTRGHDVSFAPVT